MSIYMAGVCLFVICMRHLCVCLLVRVCACACVVAFFVPPGIGSDAYGKAARTRTETGLQAQTSVHDNQICREIVEDIFKILLWPMDFGKHVALAQGIAYPILEFIYKTNVIFIVL